MARCCVSICAGLGDSIQFAHKLVLVRVWLMDRSGPPTIAIEGRGDPSIHRTSANTNLPNTVSVSPRSPGSFRSNFYINETPAFTRKNDTIFLLSLGEGGDAARMKYHRFLHLEERALLQGFTPGTIVGLKPFPMTCALGNSFSVNVVGNVASAFMGNVISHMELQPRKKALELD